VTTSEKGLELIKSFEALRLKAYRDGGGVWSLGYGHTDDVEPGDTCTAAQAFDWLKADANEAEICILTSVENVLTQAQFDALVSLVFNIGCEEFENSTILRLINAGNFTAAKGQFSRWNKDNGKIVAGLTRRRAAEAELFASVLPGYPAV
jgi:lysozyme